VQAPDATRVVRTAPAARPAPVAAPTPTQVPAPLPTEPEPEPEPEVKTFDPQTLPGVSPTLAKAMIAAGFNTRESILTGDLTAVKGIGEAKAQAIKESLTTPQDVARVLEELKAALG
jgi:predicted flap endonuclease-1-like 5' DNA nuclease